MGRGCELGCILFGTGGALEGRLAGGHGPFSSLSYAISPSSPGDNTHPFPYLTKSDSAHTPYPFLPYPSTTSLLLPSHTFISYFHLLLSHLISSHLILSYHII